MNTKDATRQLWKCCFDDSEEFVNLYFEHRFPESVNHVLEQDGQLVAALQAIPYTMTVGRCAQVPIAYVSGACTHPDYRRQGWMRRLLAQAHRSMYDQGRYFSTLIPAHEGLKAYYARSGYVSCFHRMVEKIVINRHGKPVDNFSPVLTFSKLKREELVEKSPVCTFLNERWSAQPCCVLHDADDLQVIYQDLLLDAGGVVQVWENGCRVGVAFWIPDGNGGCRVKELVLADATDTVDVLMQLGHYLQVDSVVSCRPATGSGEESGMARVVAVEAALRHYACLHLAYCGWIGVTGDDAIPENNGWFRIERGSCHKVSRADEIEKSAGADRKCFTLPRLTAWLLEGLHPYLSLMLD